MTIPAPSVLVQGIQQCKQQTLNPYKAKLDSIDQRRTQRNAVKVSAIVAAHEGCKEILGIESTLPNRM